MPPILAGPSPWLQYWGFCACLNGWVRAQVQSTEIPPEGGTRRQWNLSAVLGWMLSFFPDHTEPGRTTSPFGYFQPNSSSLLPQRVSFENCTQQKQWVLQSPSTFHSWGGLCWERDGSIQRWRIWVLGLKAVCRKA